MQQSTTAGTSPASSKSGPGAQRQVDYTTAARDLAMRRLEEARANGARKLRDRQDWWNLELYRGGERQWQVWDNNKGSFVARGTDPDRGGIPAWVPRCVTNMFGMLVDGIASLLNQTDPAKQCGPGSDDDADRAAAEIAENALPALFEEIGYDHDRGQLHKAIVLTSLAGYAVYCDNDEKWGTEDIGLLQCLNPECQDNVHSPADAYAAGKEADAVDGSGDTVMACPACGSPMQDAIYPPPHPMAGLPVTASFAKGKLCGKLVYSFELSLPRGARTIDVDRLPWVATHTRYSKDDALTRWPNLKGKLDTESRGGSGGQTASPFADAMSGLVAPLAGDGLRSAVADGPLVFELWQDPIDSDTEYFPDGLYCALVDGEIAEAGPLPFTDEDGRRIKNIRLRQFVQTPGNTAGKPPADDLAPLQVQRNMFESLLTVSLLQFAAPREYIPDTITLHDEPTGAPSERVRYRAHIPGDRPVIADGKGPAPALFDQLDKIDGKMQELSKLNAILAGQRPEGDPTLGEIQILEERGKSAFREPLDNLVDFERDLAILVLRVARQSCWTERFYKIAGDNGEWEVKKFLGADLEGNIDVFIDQAQAWPRSPLMETLQLKQLFDMGVFPQPAWQDPELCERLLAEKGMTRLKPSSDANRKQIERILDVWKGATDPAQILPPDPLIDDLKLHFATKRAWMQTEEAEQKRVDAPPVWNAMRAHLQQLQTLMAPPPQAAAPGGAPAAGGTPPSPLAAMLAQGHLKPAGAPASPASLVHAGVLKPEVHGAPGAPAAGGGAPAAGAAHS